MDKKHKIIGILYLLSLVVGAQYFFLALSAEREAKSQPTPIVVCNPDRLIVYPKETITLKAWATSPTGETLKYLWYADTGTLKGEGREVTWNFTGVLPGFYSAKVQVTNPKTGSSNCSLGVIVSLPPLDLMGGGYETGRSFLLPDQEEAKGYGLYSYLLLGKESTPKESTYQRYLNAVIEYLKFPDVKQLEKCGFKSKELNITYLPLEIQPDQKILGELKDRNYEKYQDVAKWILKHYHYARARALLRTLPQNHQAGPYIISFLEPLGKNALAPPYLFQNLSTVPPDIVNMWVNYFLYQTSKERFWDEETGKRVMLNVRSH